MRLPQQLATRLIGARFAGAVFAGVVLAGAGATGSALAAPQEPASPVASPVQTRVESFSVPAKHEIHRDFDAIGTVQDLRGGRWHGAASATVVFYYRSLPHGTWIHAGSTKAGSSGRFNWKAPVHKLGKLGWQARVQRTTVASTEYKPSRSAVKDSFLVDRTYVTHFIATHLGSDTSLAAIMQDFPQAGGVTYASVVGVARFYYRPSGAAGWNLLGKSRATKANLGSIAVEVAGTLTGKFRIVFRAQGNFLGSKATRSIR